MPPTIENAKCYVQHDVANNYVADEDAYGGPNPPGARVQVIRLENGCAQRDGGVPWRGLLPARR